MDLNIYHLLALLILIAAVVWAFGKKRKKRFEQDAKIPFLDEDKEDKDKPNK